jgi:hypothetical protein
VPAVVDSTDVASDIVGAFRAKTFGRGDTLRWSGRELTLRELHGATAMSSSTAVAASRDSRAGAGASAR